MDDKNETLWDLLFTPFFRQKEALDRMIKEKRDLECMYKARKQEAIRSLNERLDRK